MPLILPPSLVRDLLLTQAKADLGYRSGSSIISAMNLAHDFGFRHFPCSRFKTPKIDDNLNAASCDLAQLIKWFHELKPPAYGVVTGELFEVIDIDGPEGFAQFAEFEAEFGITLPDTPRVITPRDEGGMHLYYKVPEGTDPLCSTKFMRRYNKIDFKSSGGFVMGVGSKHKNGGRYAYEPGFAPDEIPFATIPPEIRDLLPKRVFPGAPRPASPRPKNCGKKTVSIKAGQADSMIIGDHPEGGSFNKPIYRRCCQFFSLFSPDADHTKFKEVLKGVILNADARNHTPDEIARYASDSYLEADLANARKHIITDRKK